MAGKFLSTPSARRATPLLKSSNFQPDDFYPRPPRGGRRGRIARESSSTVFLSTPSARRATRTRKTSIPRAEHFYPRPPRGGRPSPIWARTWTTPNFYPRPPRGGRRWSLRDLAKARRFLSTPSARRATTAPPMPGSCRPISIHALREEGDPDNKTGGKGLGYFYPRPPRGGRHAGQRRGRERGHISIHALREEGDSRQASSTTLKSNFYPRPPRGGRRSRYDNNDTGDAFLSTPSARRATSSLFHANASEAISIHALREEGDAAAPTECLCAKISIHALREEGDL